MEFERWMTPERVARSDFMRVVHQGIHDGDWDVEAAADLVTTALWGFGNGSCYFLASAVTTVTDGLVVGFWRQSEDECLVHAVVYDPSTGNAADILGRRPLAAVRDELTEAVGALRLSILPTIDDMDGIEVAVLMEIAAGLPWMGVGNGCPDVRRWASLVVGYADQRIASRTRASASPDGSSPPMSA